MKKYAMFNRDKNGIIVGFCNDSFCMTYRYNCVHIWNEPPEHYFNPQNGDFIICLNRTYDDVEVYPLTKKYYTWKGNYLFKQKNPFPENTHDLHDWVVYKDTGAVKI